jgi:hypothetical protein
MKRLTIPADVRLVDVLSGQPGDVLTFKAAACALWLNDARAASTPVKVARWSKVVHAILGAAAGDVVALDDEDHALLCEIVNSPKETYPALVMVQIQAYAAAVLEAS